MMMMMIREKKANGDGDDDDGPPPPSQGGPASQGPPPACKLIRGRYQFCAADEDVVDVEYICSVFGLNDRDVVLVPQSRLTQSACFWFFLGLAALRLPSRLSSPRLCWWPSGYRSVYPSLLVWPRGPFTSSKDGCGSLSLSLSLSLGPSLSLSPSLTSR